MSSTAAKPTPGADEPYPRGYETSADPRWARTAHRVGGLVTFGLVLGFVGVSTLLRVSPDAFNSAMAVVQHPVGVFVTVPVVGGVLFHLLDVVRVAVVDLTRWGSTRQGSLLSVISALWWALMAPAAYLITQTTLLDMFGEP